MINVSIDITKDELATIAHFLFTCRLRERLQSSPWADHADALQTFRTAIEEAAESS